MRLRAAGTAAVALALAAAGCGSHSVTTPRSTPTQTVTSTSATTSATATTPVAHAAGSSVKPPAGGPVPAGFEPASFTAISDQQFWLLGNAPCSHPVCTSIVRTSDGGRHFVGIPAPTAPLSTGTTGAGISQLRFADQLDGYAYGGRLAQGSALWETHDGGAHWRRTLSQVLGFATGGGNAYVLTGTCDSGKCAFLRLLHSPVTSDHWSATPLNVGAASSPIAMTAHATSLWLSITPDATRPQHQLLLYSSDGGANLRRQQSPCVPGLGASLEAASSTALWAVCPTGMLSAAWRSADAGATWAPASRRQELVNSAHLAAASGTTAVVAPGGGSRLLLTTDGGRVYNQVFGRGSGSASWMFLGFTDPSTGSGLLEVGYSERTGVQAQLWRSSDGGVHWHGPVHIG
jgi:photosystem II stability/assembly factor-like uncharacterized protein